MADDNQNNEGTLKKAIRGGKWMFFNTVAQKIISLSSFFVLARLLAPEDFGIITLLFIVPNFLGLLTELGFGIALIQTKEDPKQYLNEAWTLDVLKASFIFVIVFFSAPLIANFFHIEKAILAIRLSGIFVLIGGFANVAQLFFFKEIDFKKLFIRDFVASLGYAVVAVSFAIFYRSFWPLFFGYVAQYLSGAISTYVLHPYRPRFSFKFGKFKTLIGYSKWIFGQNLIINAVPMVENGLIGRFVNTTGVGLYSRAKSLAILPSAPIYNIIDRVTFPAYSKVQDSYEKIRDGLIKSLDILFVLTIPFILLFMEAGRRIILIFLGEKWIGLDALLKVLLIAVTVNVLNALSGPVFNAIGKPRIQFYITILNISTLVALLLLLIPTYGTIGVAFGILINSAIIFLVSFYKLIKLLNIKIAKILGGFLVSLILSVAVLAVGKIILIAAGEISDVAFIVLLSLLGILYGLSIILAGVFFNLGPYKTLKLILSEIIKN